MNKLFFIILILSFNALSEECNYKINSNDIKLVWTAFKTPLKKGVPGTFDDYGIQKEFSGKSLKDLLTSVKFNINTSSVNTNNKSRDAKIAKFFFGNMAGDKISGKFISYSKKVLTVELSMNGVTKEVPMSVTIDKENFEAKGFIDVLDFSLAKSLAGINRACLELHQGKTWSDVVLELSAKLLKSCDK